MKKVIKDILSATARASVSLLPGGAFVTEYIGLVQSFVADKRIDEWKEKVD